MFTLIFGIINDNYYLNRKFTECDYNINIFITKGIAVILYVIGPRIQASTKFNSDQIAAYYPKLFFEKKIFFSFYFFSNRKIQN